MGKPLQTVKLFCCKFNMEAVQVSKGLRRKIKAPRFTFDHFCSKKVFHSLKLDIGLLL